MEGNKLKDTEKIVMEIISNVILKKKRNLVKPEANLREDLGIDSIKMIAIASMLVEKGIDVNASDASIDFTRIETVQDVIDVANSIVSQ
jgi:acyl carrier protein